MAKLIPYVFTTSRAFKAQPVAPLTYRTQRDRERVLESIPRYWSSIATYYALDTGLVLNELDDCVFILHPVGDYYEDMYGRDGSYTVEHSDEENIWCQRVRGGQLIGEMVELHLSRLLEIKDLIQREEGEE